MRRGVAVLAELLPRSLAFSVHVFARQSYLLSEVLANKSLKDSPADFEHVEFTLKNAVEIVNMLDDLIDVFTQAVTFYRKSRGLEVRTS